MPKIFEYFGFTQKIPPALPPKLRDSLIFVPLEHFLYFCKVKRRRTKQWQKKTTTDKVQSKTQESNATSPKKVSKTWEAAMRLKGSLIVNDPTFLL